MNCEICGKIIDRPATILIDETQFDVCEGCSSLGKKLEVKDERTERKSFQAARTKNFASGNTLSESTLIEGFGKKIMQARQKKGLTLKELAIKLYEKESVIQRIESEKFVPEDKTIKKIERELEISLTE
ncbi:MAG: multiprotein-bridging factor 1 family protein [archaeon]